MVGPPYLDPGQVDPARAKLVLDFLNAAKTPDEIAIAVEFPGEPDIGVRLAERLLKARDELGGFTDIKQVRAIRLIGPERFTEIVAALSGHPLPTDPIEELRAEVAALRSRIGTGGPSALPQRRLVLHTLEPNAYLGQPVSVVATLLDAGEPAVDVPITFVATRGALRASDGYATHHGHLITARTGVDGLVRLSVLPTTTEELSPLQQDALSALLVLLDPKAETPEAGAQGLRALARQYSWEVNLALREAIDIYVREFRPMLLDTVNLRENLAAWSFYDSAVLAFAPVEGNGTNGSSVSATAALHLRVRNWIPAFLEAFVALARAESGLTNELRDLSRGAEDGARLVNDIYSRAAKYVGSQWGNVGAYVGRKVAEASIRTVIEQDLNQLPLDTRVAVFPALDGASKTLATTDTAVLQALVGTRKDITETVNKRTDALGDLGGVLGTLNQLEATIAALPDADDLTSLRTELLRSMDAALVTKVDNTSFDTFRTDVNRQLSTVRTSMTAMDTRITRIGR